MTFVAIDSLRVKTKMLEQASTSIYTVLADINSYSLVDKCFKPFHAIMFLCRSNKVLQALFLCFIIVNLISLFSVMIH